MPWSNNTGGGRNGGNAGGPWGQRPQGPVGGQPDLEDIIRRGQDRLRGFLPGGGGNSMMTLIVIAALVLMWVFQATYSVQPDELAVELRFGKPKETLSEPGLHFHFWPVETVERVTIREQQLNIGSSSRAGGSTGLMLSGDQNIVDLEFTILWQVSVPNDYLFNVRDPQFVVQQVAEAAVREIVGRRPAEDVFRDDRAGIAEEVRVITQNTLDSYGSGVRINTVNIEDVAPPPEVADAFDEVQRAEQDEDRFVEEANRYSNRILGAARGEAAQIREDAAGYKNRVVQEATGEAQRFVSVYDQYVKAPDVTRKRLFLETMERVLKSSSKVIVEQGSGQGVVPYLPLPEIEKRRTAGDSQ